MLDDMLAGNTRIAAEWVGQQPATARPALRAAAKSIHGIAYDLMLRDVPLFMKFKTPDPPPLIARDLFRGVIDAAMGGGDPAAVRSILAASSLDELYALIRICDAVNATNG